MSSSDANWLKRRNEAIEKCKVMLTERYEGKLDLQFELRDVIDLMCSSFRDGANWDRALYEPVRNANVLQGVRN